VSKDKVINIRLSEEELKIITGKAGKFHMSISEYVRFAAIMAEIKVEV